MPRTALDVGNSALALVGADRIAAFDDGSAEGAQLSMHYEAIVGQALVTPGGSPYRWSFATQQNPLNRLENGPWGRWLYAYQMPPDLLRLHALTMDGYPVEHQIHGDRILCNVDGRLIADYTFRAQEAAWPPDFFFNVVQELASRLALGLNENAPLARALAAGTTWPGSRTGDSQSRTPQRLRFSRLTGARGSGRGIGTMRPGAPAPDDTTLLVLD